MSKIDVAVHVLTVIGLVSMLLFLRTEFELLRIKRESDKEFLQDYFRNYYRGHREEIRNFLDMHSKRVDTLYKLIDNLNSRLELVRAKNSERKKTRVKKSA